MQATACMTCLTYNIVVVASIIPGKFPDVGVVIGIRLVESYD
jgi:hypothetical protein